jgi:hypothetical protein
VKVGDKVVFGQYAGSNTIEVDGEELILMSESEIYAVLRPKHSHPSYRRSVNRKSKNGS